ncbi:LbetaH domain-containing protein [Elioraea rosea]|uniref:transferase n=1 Tax=Elioraea rosea TaxID=2492390 RepID=UPI001183F4E1|nr:transferase [Elioraea rosea]
MTLVERLTRQLRYVVASEAEIPSEVLADAERRMAHCIANVAIKRYETFRPEHTAQYAIFLYFLSNSAFRMGVLPLAEGAYALNKALHAVELFYEVELPAVFVCDHPLGSVMGRARYGERFSFAQGCTVGNSGGIYPVIGSNVAMCANATVLGRATVGDGAIIAAGTLVVDQDVPAGMIAFGRSPALVFKPVKPVTRALFSFFRTS